MTEREKLEVQVTTQGADRAARELDTVSKKADELDNKKVGINLADSLGALAGPAGAIAALGAGAALIAEGTADAAIEADNLAALTGDSVEQASRLNAVWKQTGADTKDLQDVLLQMNGVLATNTQLAEQLGVNLDDGATVGQRFEQVAEALDKIPDAAKRSQIASQVFGEEGVRQYNALRQAVGDVGTAMENVAAGSVFTDDDVEQARKMKQELIELKANLVGFANTAGKIAIPALNGLIDGTKAWFNGMEEAGHSLRNFLTTGNITSEADKIVQAFADSESAARDFDRSLLDGLTTFEQVRQKVIDLTGDVTAANIVALEWKATQDQLPPAIDAVTEALNSGDASWQKYIDSQERGLAIADGAPGTFEEMAAAAKAAMSDVSASALGMADDFGAAIQSMRDKVDFLGEAFDDVRSHLDLRDLLDDITDQFATIAEAQKHVGEDGEEGARRYDRAVRDLQRQLLRLVDQIDTIPASKKVEFITAIETGSLEDLYRILGDLTKGVTVPVSFAGAKIPGFNSANGVFTPGAAPPAPTFSGVSTPVPVQLDQRQITYNFPVGTTVTSQYQNDQINQRRNGNR